jgi:hypothetical protein
MEVRRTDDFEIDEDIRHSEREWRFERAGWAIMGLVALAALLGLLGNGPLSKASASAGGMTVRYDRLDRAHAQSRIRVELASPGSSDGTVRLWIDRRYLDGLRIVRMDPEPERSEISPDRVTHSFPYSGAPLAINIHFEFDEGGTHTGRAGVSGGPEVDWEQFAFP